MRIYMQMAAFEDKPPRFYHLFLQPDLIEGWTLVKEWGFQGSGGRLKKEHYPGYDEAEKALMLSRDAQAKRGYRVVFVEGQREQSIE